MWNKQGQVGPLGPKKEADEAWMHTQWPQFGLSLNKLWAEALLLSISFLPPFLFSFSLLPSHSTLLHTHPFASSASFPSFSSTFPLSHSHYSPCGSTLFLSFSPPSSSSSLRPSSRSTACAMFSNHYSHHRQQLINMIKIIISTVY